MQSQVIHEHMLQMCKDLKIEIDNAYTCSDRADHCPLNSDLHVDVICSWTYLIMTIVSQNVIVAEFSPQQDMMSEAVDIGEWQTLRSDEDLPVCIDQGQLGLLWQLLHGCHSHPEHQTRTHLSAVFTKTSSHYTWYGISTNNSDCWTPCHINYLPIAEDRFGLASSDWQISLCLFAFAWCDFMKINRHGRLSHVLIDVEPISQMTSLYAKPLVWYLIKTGHGNQIMLSEVDRNLVLAFW